MSHRGRLAMLLAVGVLLAPGTAFGFDELRVNAFSFGQQWEPNVATASDGSFVVVWTSGTGIYAKAFRPNRLSAGPDQQVNQPGADLARYPSVGVDGSGKFVVTWVERTGTTWSVKARRYAAFGQECEVGATPLGPEITVAQRPDEPTVSFDMSFTGIGVAPDGRFVVSWIEQQFPGEDEAKFRIYDAGDIPLATTAQQILPRFHINQFRFASDPKIAPASWGFLVTWIDDGATFGQILGDLVARRYDWNGQSLDASTTLIDTLVEQGGVDVATTPDQTVLIAYRRRQEQPTIDNNVYLVHYGTAALHAPIQVNPGFYDFGQRTFNPGVGVAVSNTDPWDAVVVWNLKQTINGSRDDAVFARHYLVGPTPTPSTPDAVQIDNGSGFAELLWGQSPVAMIDRGEFRAVWWGGPEGSAGEAFLRCGQFSLAGEYAHQRCEHDTDHDGVPDRYDLDADIPSVGYDLDQDSVADGFLCGATAVDCANSCSSLHTGDATAIQTCVDLSCRLDNCIDILSADCFPSKQCVDGNDEDCFLLDTICEQTFGNPGQEDQDGDGTGDLCQPPTPPLIGAEGKLVVTNLRDAPDPFDADIETNALSMDVEVLHLPGSSNNFDFTCRVVWQIESPWTGAVVRTLISEHTVDQTGMHSMSLVWDGMSDQGTALPDGQYDYQVRVDLIRAHKTNDNNIHNLDTVLRAAGDSVTIERAVPIPPPSSLFPDLPPAPSPDDPVNRPPTPRDDPPLESPPEDPTVNPVGRIEGAFSVTAAGTAQYVIPLIVPPGRQGIQPELEFVYTSNQRDGHLGVGWSLRGLSRIERCGSSLAFDGQVRPVKYDNTLDNFCLDGTRLIVIISPASGMIGGTVYATKRDSFRKVVAYGSGPDYFEVHLKNGRVLTYGCDEETLEPGQRGNCSATMFARNDFPAVWALRQVRDRKQNYMRFEYEKSLSQADEDWNNDGTQDYLGSPEAIEFVPKRIRYTGNMSGQGQRDPNREVLFVYYPAFITPPQGDPIFDGFQGHRNGIRTRLSKRLAGVMTRVGGQSALNYYLSYKRSDTSGRSLLTQIDLCDASSQCVTPTYFNWSDAKIDNSSVWEADPILLPTPSDGSLTSTTSADVNGDGFDDILYIRDERWRLMISTGDPSAPFNTEINTLISATAGDRAFPHDIDNDGFVDLIIQQRGLDHLRAYRWVGGEHWSEFAEVTHDITVAAGFEVLRDNTTFNVKGQRWVLFGDISGDGLADYLFCPIDADGEDATWLYRLNRGDGLFGEERNTIFGCNAEPGFLEGNYPFLLDTNGDGALELIHVLPGSTPSFRDWHAIDFATATPTIRFNLFPAMGWTHGADVNGDGLTDVLQNPFDFPFIPTDSSNHHIYVWLNTGDGFIGGDGGLPGGYVDLHYNDLWLLHNFTLIPNPLGWHHVADFTQDGRDDVLVVEPRWKHYDPDVDMNEHCLGYETGLYLLRGDDGLRDFPSYAAGGRALHWQATPLVSLPVCNRSDKYDGDRELIADIDGDGQPDIVKTVGDRLIVRFHGGGKRDLITHIRDGLIGIAPSSPIWPAWSQRFTHEITYADSSDPDVYSQAYFEGQAPVGCSHPMSCGRPKGVLVSRHRSYNGENNPATSAHYSYHDSRSDRLGLGWLGFGQVVQRDDTTGSVSIQTFDNYTRDVTTNMYSFAGSIISNKTYVQPVALGPYLVEKNTFTYALKDQGLWMNGKTYLPYVREARLRRYETTTPSPQLSDTPLSGRDVTTDIDIYGNPTLVTVTGLDGNAENRTELSYYYNTTQWVLGQLQSLTVRDTAASGQSASRQVDFTYFGDRFLVKTKTFRHENSNRRLKIEYQRDGFGNVLKETLSTETGKKRVSDTSYEFHGVYPDRVINPAGHVMRFGFNQKFGTVGVYETPNGNQLKWVHDGLGRPTRFIYPNLAEYTYHYGSINMDGVSFLTTHVQLAAEITERTVFDAAFRPIRRESRGLNGATNAIELEYHVYGNLGRKSIPYDVTTGSPTAWTTYLYDRAGQVSRVTAPDFAQFIYEHDRNRTNVYFGNQLVKSTEKNGLGQVVNVRDALDHITQYTYGPFGFLSTITDNAGHLTSMVTDGYGNILELTEPNTGNHILQYNSFGEVEKNTDSNGDTTEFRYDSLGRVRKWVNKGGTTSYFYDGTNGLGRIQRIEGPTGHIKRFVYDQQELLETVITELASGGTYSFSWEYDGRLRPLVLHYPTVENQTFAIQYVYDTAGNRTEILTHPGARSIWRAEEANAFGLVTEFSYEDGASHTVREFDPHVPRLKRIETWDSSLAFTQALRYTYYSDGNLLDRAIYDPATQLDLAWQTFEYDDLDRLLTYTYCFEDVLGPSCNPQRTVTYDPMGLGNIASKSDVGSYTYGDPDHPNAVTQAGGDVYFYDDVGNQVDRPDALLRYNASNKVERVTSKSDGSSTIFDYDPRGDRLKLVRPNGDETVYVDGLFEHFAAAGGNRAYSFHVKLGNRIIASQRRVWDPGTSTFQSSIRYLHHDHLGSVNVVTDAQQNLLQRVWFDPFGVARDQNWDGPPTGMNQVGLQYGFTGHLHDDGLPGGDLIDAGGRNYDPRLGRFLSVDPFSSVYDLQGMNRYSYVRNQPLNFTDPTGYWVDSLYDDPFSSGSSTWTPFGNLSSGVGPLGLNIRTVDIRNGRFQWTRLNPRVRSYRSALFGHTLSPALSGLSFPQQASSAIIPTRSHLVSMINHPLGRALLKGLIPNYHRSTRPSTQNPSDGCHNDMCDLLDRLRGEPVPYLVSYKGPFRSRLTEEGVTFDWRMVLAGHNDKIVWDDLIGNRFSIKIRGYGRDNGRFVRRVRLKPGMIVHSANRIERGRFAGKHWVMYLGRIPGLGGLGPMALDSLVDPISRPNDPPGQIVPFNESATVFGRSNFWRVAAIRDPWQGRE